MFLRLLGSARLESNGTPVRGRAAHRRRLGVLALLVAAPADRGVSRERIIGLLWPDSGPDAARKLLSESLYVLRKELGDAVIIATGDELALDHRALPSDVHGFRCAVAQGELARAADAYQGPFLDAWYVDDAPEFERWAVRERESLSNLYRDCLGRLAESAEVRGDWHEAVHWWQSLANADPYSGRVALRLAQAHVAGGERARALQTLAAYEAALRAEMEVPPEPALVTFAKQLREAPEGGSVMVPSSRRAHEARTVPSTVLPPTLAASPSTPRPRHVRAVALAAVAVAAVGLTFAAGSLGGGNRTVATFLPQFDPNDVAIRPFKDLSGRNEAIAYALTDELILRLTGVAPVRVASRTAVMRARDSTIGLDSLARALKVGTIIEGTVREAAGKISAMVLVTDVGTGKYVGATEVTSDTGDYFTLVDELATRIERDFRRRLGESFRLRELTRGTASGEATRLMAEAQRAVDLGRETSREWRADAIQVSRRYLLAADSVLRLANSADRRWTQPLLKRAFVASRLAASDPPGAGARRLGSAIALLDQALLRDESNAAAYELRGKLYFQRYLTYARRDTTNHDLRLAIADLEAAKSLDSLRVGAWVARAFAAWFVLDTVAARRNIEGAARLDAYLDGETDILLNKFLVALWLRDWEAARDACITGRRQDPWSYLFLQCQLTLARHDTASVPQPKWAWAVVDTLSRMYPSEKAALASRFYSPIYWRVLAATISARAGDRRLARIEMDSAVARAERHGVLTDLAPDRAYFEWSMGDTARAVSLMADFLRERHEQRVNMRADALLGPIVAIVSSK